MSPQLYPDTASTTSVTPHCSPLSIPEGVFIVNDTFEVTITGIALFKPHCTGGGSGIIRGGPNDPSTVTDPRDPFYASTSPQIFAIAVATVISYFLVILIFITPRTFFVGGPGGGAGFLTRRGLGGSSSTIGVGQRPLLQKLAAIMVALSMTIATADTFKVAKSQYEDGFLDSQAMVRQVVGLLEIRIVQVVSDTFVWLAQVQTLIRLFPRHKEKVTIKWLGFALISLDVVFSSINHFYFYGKNPRPENRTRDAVPALSYLFELAIGFIYASCIIFYAISKYRYAFYHAKMRNICLVALLSLTSVLIPVVFFIIDVSSPGIATWGFYIEWVGAAAASVVVWEWVERIEALERDEKKDGILGREIYDGDEMLDATMANGVDWPRRPPRRGRGGDGNQMEEGQMGRSKRLWEVHGRRIRSRIPFGNIKSKPSTAIAGARVNQSSGRGTQDGVQHSNPPAVAPSPVNRTDTTSAASTVYAIRYHDIKSVTPPSARHGEQSDTIERFSQEISSSQESGDPEKEKIPIVADLSDPNDTVNASSRPLWMNVPNPFKRKRALPPAEVAGAQLLEENAQLRSQGPTPSSEKWRLRPRLNALRPTQRDKVRSRRQGTDTGKPLPVTIIPAQERGSKAKAVDTSGKADGKDPNDKEHGSGRLWNMFSKPSIGSHNMEVTVVPAPVQGQRTWSPDDMLSTTQQPEQPEPSRGRSIVARDEELPPNGRSARYGYRQHKPDGEVGINGPSPEFSARQESASTPGPHLEDSPSSNTAATDPSGESGRVSASQIPLPASPARPEQDPMTRPSAPKNASPAQQSEEGKSDRGPADGAQNDSTS